MFQIINNLYIRTDSEWIISLEEKDIEPLVINRFLAMNSNLAKVTAYLDKYTFHLAKKSWLLLAWSTIPKRSKPPFVKYIKKNKDEEAINVFYKKLQRLLKISDNDMISVKKFIHKDVEENKVEWFARLGMKKEEWMLNNLDYEKIRGDKEPLKGLSGLEKYGF